MAGILVEKVDCEHGLGICIGVHVDDMLAVGPSEPTKNQLQELSKDMAMRWTMVADKP